MSSFSTWLTALMLLLFSSMVALAFQYPPNARLAPLIIGVPGMLLCLFQLGLDAVNAQGGPFANHRFRFAPKIGRPDPPAEEPSEFGPHTVSRELVMWGYFLAFIAAVLALGFYAAVPVLLASFLYFEAGVRLPLALMTSAGGTATLYLIFGIALRLELFPGFVTRSVLQALGV